LAITLEATFEEIEETIHAHPTLSEAVHEATGAGIVFHEGASLSRWTTPRLSGPRFEMLS
jgi:hypothetical protein